MRALQLASYTSQSNEPDHVSRFLGWDCSRDYVKGDGQTHGADANIVDYVKAALMLHDSIVSDGYPVNIFSLQGTILDPGLPHPSSPGLYLPGGREHVSKTS